MEFHSVGADGFRVEVAPIGRRARVGARSGMGRPGGRVARGPTGPLWIAVGGVAAHVPACHAWKEAEEKPSVAVVTPPARAGLTARSCRLDARRGSSAGDGSVLGAGGIRKQGMRV